MIISHFHGLTHSQCPSDTKIFHEKYTTFLCIAVGFKKQFDEKCRIVALQLISFHFKSPKLESEKLQNKFNCTQSLHADAVITISLT